MVALIGGALTVTFSEALCYMPAGTSSRYYAHLLHTYSPGVQGGDPPESQAGCLDRHFGICEWASC